MSSTQITCELDRQVGCIKNLLAWHDEPYKPTKAGPLAYVILESPFCLRFKSRHGPLKSNLFRCLHEKANPDAGNPEERITSRTKTKKPDGKLQMTGKHCLAGWWLVAAGVYLDQVQAQLLAADSPFHHTTHNNPIYD
jgi:hypothetical protein